MLRAEGIFDAVNVAFELFELVNDVPQFEHVFHADKQGELVDGLAEEVVAPGGEGTRKWLNAARIAKLPKGAVVVNTSRGTSVDDEALISALRQRLHQPLAVGA